MSKILFDNVKYYYNKIDSISDILANLLSNGNLALVIGGGVSKAIGFPDMKELIKKCYINLELTKYTASEIDNKKPSELLLVVDDIEGYFKEKPRDYFSFIKNCLYDGVTDYEKKIIESKMHLAIGALIANSHRGYINRVITLNFDDALETYLKILGFKAQVITESYYLTESNRDVVIYHPNGYLPKESNDNSENLILSQYSFEKRISQADNRWNKIFEYMFLDYIVLFVGVSGNDPVFGPLLFTTAKINQQYNRPTGFWLFGPRKQESSLSDDYFLQRNVIPHHFENYEEIPLFLLKVCQLASELNT